MWDDRAHLGATRPPRTEGSPCVTVEIPVHLRPPVAFAVWFVAVTFGMGCALGGGRGVSDSGQPSDSGALADARLDGARSDTGGGATDSSLADTTISDAASDDAARTDVGASDAGRDTGSGDTGAATDTGVADSGPPTGTGDCISGAVGTHAVRFRWEGSGGTAYVRYEENELPDTSRWRVTANAMGFGYTPEFVDPFLGEGGLELSGSVFIDVELSTVGLSSISNVTLSIYGRSFNTTSSGSFEWMSFDGAGAAPSGLVHNSAPYEWYGANATSAFAPGNDGVLFRIYPGPPSNSLVVNQVELCFDAG